MDILSSQRMTIIPMKPNVFSLEEVSYHTDVSSCWIVIQDKVYDLTNFLDEVIARCVDCKQDSVWGYIRTKRKWRERKRTA